MIDQTLLQQQLKRLTELQEVLEKEFAALKTTSSHGVS